jgi:hypothetical protein
MQIDIDRLNEAELIALNLRIVARLRLLWQIDAHNSMLGFKIGEKVIVKREGRPPIAGVITRYNKKTVSIVTQAGQRWNVSPWLLQKAKSRRPSGGHKNNVVVLVRKDEKKV